VREVPQNVNKPYMGKEGGGKICALTFETSRSSDVYNYMIFYIIIGHRSNKVQSLLDIDEFFSKKTHFFFFEKKI
jgi:hypothetical protein